MGKELKNKTTHIVIVRNTFASGELLTAGAVCEIDKDISADDAAVLLNHGKARPVADEKLKKAPAAPKAPAK